MNHTRKHRASKDWAWINWYISRGRLDPEPSSERHARKLLRQLSWRRAF